MKCISRKDVEIVVFSLILLMIILMPLEWPQKNFLYILALAYVCIYAVTNNRLLKNITENFETPESGNLKYSDGSVRRFVFIDQDNLMKDKDN